MKKGALSIVFAIIGFYCIYRFNTLLHNERLTLLQSGADIDLTSDISVFKKTYKIIIINIGLLSLYFGIISFLKKNKVGLIGIILALILILSSLFPFLENIIESYSNNISFH